VNPPNNPKTQNMFYVKKKKGITGNNFFLKIKINKIL
jgi:hypothetical protein